MLTTCPECHTAFRVSQAQLDSRRGLVRCGRCSAVFNAYDSLLPELETPPSVPDEAEPAPRPDADLAPPAAAVTCEPPSTEPVGLAEPAPGLVEAVAALKEPGGGEQAPAEAVEPSLSPAALAASPAAAQTESADAILLADLPLPRRREGKPWRWQTGMWALAATLLAALLVAQMVYFLRLEIAAWLPQTRPWLTDACRQLGCAMPLPRDLAAVRIEASSLESDPENAARAVLHVTLGNRSDRVVAWPHLILILTDVRDAPIAQRPITPEEYLTADGRPDSGMRPGQERELRLELEFLGLSAYGYKLDKQYP